MNRIDNRLVLTENLKNINLSLFLNVPSTALAQLLFTKTKAVPVVHLKAQMNY